MKVTGSRCLGMSCAAVLLLMGAAAMKPQPAAMKSASA